MGSTKISTESQQTSKATPTPEETEMNRLQMEQFKKVEPAQTEMMQTFFGLGNRMGKGQSLPGYLSPLTEGISEGVTSDIVQKSLKDLYPQFQNQGILDSGTAASAAARTAGDIRRGSAEFNIGNLQNLLNLALSGQAQIQQPTLGASGQLSERLAGLRTVTGSGSGAQRNPFTGLSLGIFGKWGGSNAGV